MLPAGIQLDQHGVLERLTHHHVHVEQRELPYSTVKLGEQDFHVNCTFGRAILSFVKEGILKQSFTFQEDLLGGVLHFLEIHLLQLVWAD